MRVTSLTNFATPIFPANWYKRAFGWVWERVGCGEMCRPLQKTNDGTLSVAKIEIELINCGQIACTPVCHYFLLPFPRLAFLFVPFFVFRNPARSSGRVDIYWVFCSFVLFLRLANLFTFLARGNYISYNA